jgi:hypothetical protein
VGEEEETSPAGGPRLEFVNRKKLVVYALIIVPIVLNMVGATVEINPLLPFIQSIRDGLRALYLSCYHSLTVYKVHAALCPYTDFRF